MKTIAMLAFLVSLCACTTTISYRALDYKVQKVNSINAACKAANLDVNLDLDDTGFSRTLVLQNRGAQPLEIDTMRLSAAFNKQVQFPLMDRVDPTVLLSQSRSMSYVSAQTEARDKSDWGQVANVRGAAMAAASTRQFRAREIIVILPGETLQLAVENLPNSLHLNTLTELRSDYVTLPNSIGFARIYSQGGYKKANEWVYEQRTAIVARADKLPQSVDDSIWSFSVPYRNLNAQEWAHACAAYKIEDPKEITVTSDQSHRYVSDPRSNLASWKVLPQFSSIYKKIDRPKNKL